MEFRSESLNDKDWKLKISKKKVKLRSWRTFKCHGKGHGKS